MSERASVVPIMFVVPCFGYGGLEQVVLYLAKKLDRKAFRPSFCTLGAPEPALYAQLQECGIDCFVVEKGSGVNYGLPIRLARLIRRLGVRIVNGHDVGATFYACLAAQLGGAPRVIHTEHSQALTISRHLPVHRWLMRHLVHYSIAVSNELARHLETHLQIPKDRITYIPNAIDAERFAAPASGMLVREELGLDAQDFVVGTIGRLTEQKGQSDLLRAFPSVMELRANSKLVLIGSGELRSELEALAVSLGIRDKVIFAGNRGDIPAVLRALDVFVLPSLWEGQPMTLMEAMAAGQAIVASDVSDNGTLLGNGERGVLVEPGNVGKLSLAIRHLASDAANARTLRNRAQEYALREFSAPSMVRRHEEVFLRVLAGDH